MVLRGAKASISAAAAAARNFVALSKDGTKPSVASKIEKIEKIEKAERTEKLESKVVKKKEATEVPKSDVEKVGTFLSRLPSNVFTPETCAADQVGNYSL